MKIKLIILTLVSSILASCSSIQSNDFEATINIKGITSQRIYITVFGDKENTVINYSDSIKTVIDAKDGVFTISGTLSEPAVLRVSFSDDKQFYKMAGRGYFPVKSGSLWFVATPGGNLDIEGDLTNKDFIAIYPDGDFENKLFARLSTQMMPLINDGGNIAVKLAIDTTLSEITKKELDQQAEKIDNQVAAIREKFVSKNPSCIAALWLMEDMLIRKQIKIEALEPLLEKVESKYHNNYFYISVKNRVEGAKKSTVGAKCPPIKGIDQFGNKFDIQSLQGKYVIIDFWGTWCGACLAGMPDMKAFKEAHTNDLEIVGVAKDSNVEQWKACIKKHAMNWPNILIGTGEQDYASKFNVQGYPTKILLGPDGTILHRSSGESKDFYVEIEKIIKNHNNNYIIRGTVEDSSLNGTTVYMISGNKNDESSHKDSTVISNGKYTFKGNASISECGNIHTKRKNNNESPAIYTTIVLEHGIIEIYTNKNHETFVSGTSLNDAYQRHMNNINAEGDKIDAIRKQLDNHRNGVALLSDKQIAQLHDAADSISKKRFEIDYNGVKANINNPAICNNRLGVAADRAGSIEKMKELISGANELTKRHPEYKSVVERIATLERTAIGQPFIDFQMLDPNGKRVSLSDYVGKGKYVLVDFWASWCGPCRAEMPNIVKTYDKYAGDDFEIVGVSFDSKKEAWTKSINEMKLTWPHMSDLKGSNCAAAKLYAISGIPHTILFDRKGKIIARNLHGEELNLKLESLLSL